MVVSLMGISTSYLIFELARDFREQRSIQRENMEIERYYRQEYEQNRKVRICDRTTNTDSSSPSDVN